MSESIYSGAAPRVALLSRPGKAADNLTDALREAGAELVLLADPSDMDEGQLRAANAEAVLVALEPGLERAIEALSGALSSPELTVIFDEAEIAAHRAGWDAARWIRHLSAKLRRHNNVLPPGTESDQDWHPKPRNLASSDESSSKLDIAPFAEEASERVDAVPADGLPGDVFEAALQSPEATPQTVEVAALARDTNAVSSLNTKSNDEPWPELSFVPIDPVPAVVVDVPQRDEAQLNFEATALDGVDLDSVVAEPEPTATNVIAADAASNDIFEIETQSLDESTVVLDYVPMQLDEDAFFEQTLSTVGASRSEGAESVLLSSDDPVGVYEFSAEDAETSLNWTPRQVDHDGLDHPELERAELERAELEHVELAQNDADRSIAKRHETVMSFDELIAQQTAHDDLGRSAIAESAALNTSETPTPAPTTAPVKLPSFGELSLAEDHEVQPAIVEAPRDTDKRKHDLSALEARISGLSLVDLDQVNTNQVDTNLVGTSRDDTNQVDSNQTDMSLVDASQTAQSISPQVEDVSIGLNTAQPPPLPADSPSLRPLEESAAGSINAINTIKLSNANMAVVLIEAGLGGPDPVRQLLAELPANFPMPVLVRLHLQGGRYDRLVTQMQRASALPVALAEVEMNLRGGMIYFVPDGLTVAESSGRKVFVNDTGGIDAIFTAMAVADCAVVFLSGSDPMLIDATMNAASSGALVLGQTPEDCYDGIACGLLRERGIEIALPTELASKLALRWPG